MFLWVAFLQKMVISYSQVIGGGSNNNRGPRKGGWNDWGEKLQKYKNENVLKL